MSERTTPYDESDFWAADGIANPTPQVADEEAVAAAPGDDEPTTVLAAPEDAAETRVLFDGIFVDDVPRRPAAAPAPRPAFIDRIFSEGIDLAPVVAQGFQDTPFSESLFRNGIELSPLPEAEPAPEPESRRPWYTSWVIWVVVAALALIFAAVVWATGQGEDPPPAAPTAQVTETVEPTPDPEEPADKTPEPTPEATESETTPAPEDEGGGWTWPWDNQDWTWPWDNNDADPDTTQSPEATPTPTPEPTEPPSEPDSDQGWTWPWQGDDWEWWWNREGFRWPWQGEEG